MQQALRQAIQAKKNLYDFYCEAEEATENLEGKMVLQRLRDEVGENISKFFNYYKNNDLSSLDDFMATPPQPGSVMLAELRKALDEKVHARKARELAMQEEKSIEMSFRRAAQEVIDPVVRNIFLEVADDAARHYAIIESEYEYQITHIHESDVDTYVRE
jgi:rubrerythrin